MLVHPTQLLPCTPLHPPSRPQAGIVYELEKKPSHGTSRRHSRNTRPPPFDARGIQPLTGVDSIVYDHITV
ncbi:hypothetical protein LIA77_08274 [Sarocladium implicatum]|nr:hypothetical protein LIA77_08274 [Sarocladium implicatum]